MAASTRPWLVAMKCASTLVADELIEVIMDVRRLSPDNPLWKVRLRRFSSRFADRVAREAYLRNAQHTRTHDLGEHSLLLRGISDPPTR